MEPLRFLAMPPRRCSGSAGLVTLSRPRLEDPKRLREGREVASFCL